MKRFVRQVSSVLLAYCGGVVLGANTGWNPPEAVVVVAFLAVMWSGWAAGAGPEDDA